MPELKPMTELIKRHGVALSTRKMNDRLLAMGLLEERTRASTADPSKTKKFKALTEAGLEFGENVANDYNDETQPKYFNETFPALVEKVLEDMA